MIDKSIFQCNNLIKAKSGVWRLKEQPRFHYSDSDEVENNINEIITNSDDRSSLSIELEDKIFNWASEYHLSSQRANLFRFLNLKKVESMLELGCGCGANTRFLGESGIHIDAIEGSERRAKISRDRCEDLENVNVICSNFNDLAYPEDSYGCVSLIGVLEYAKKYNEGSKDDEHAVTEILSKAKKALKDKGLLIISIENRMGLKYWLGASEDHLGRPYAGIYGYPGNNGIKTYTKREWEKVLNHIGFKSYRFCYPFPDYKLPRLILSDRFLCNEPFAYSLLYRIASRDYDREWHPEPNEFFIWKSLCESGDIESFSNSFFIIASTSTEYLDGLIPYDFMQFPDPGRKQEYRVITYKPSGTSYVYKEPLVVNNENNNKHGKIIGQIDCRRSEYLKGELLSSIWLSSLEENSDDQIFLRLLQAYYSYLKKHINSSEMNCEYLDLLPSNIIVDREGKLHIIDQEWSIKEKITPEFVFFRALFWFTVHNKYVISKFVKRFNYSTVNDFIKYCFGAVSLNYDDVELFKKLETKIHDEITRGFASGQFEKMLCEPLKYEDNITLHQNEELENKIKYITSEIEAIKNSRVWRLAVFIRIFFYDKLLGRFPLLHKSALYLSREGVWPFISKTTQYISVKTKFLSSRLFKNSYDRWIERNEIQNYDIPAIKEDIAKMDVMPVISVIMPVYNVNRPWLEMAIQSVTNQIYDKWELCIVDDASTLDHVKESIGKYENRDSRIKTKYFKKNQGISGASNEALSIATGDFIALLDHDDELSKDALYEIVKLINKHPDAQMIYSDEDMIDQKGRRMNPYFKPDWSPDTLLSGNYITHLSVYKKSIVDEIGGFRKGYEGSQDYDLALRFTEKASEIYHIPKILYHWRKIEGSVAASSKAKNYAYDNAKKALEDVLHRRNIKGEIEFGHGTGYYVMKRHVDNRQVVSIIVLSLKPSELLYNCVESIEKNTTINNYEILIPVFKKNQHIAKITKLYSNCHIIQSDKELTSSSAYNLAAIHAKGKHLVFLEDNMQVISNHWLTSLLEHSQRPEIGLVGAKILYPDKKTIQHAGIILGINNIAGNAYKKSNDRTEHYFGHLNIIRNYSAVSNSCMMIKNHLFQEIGGFDEENLPFSYSDIDLCLRVKDMGLNNIYTPFSVLAKQENKTDIEFPSVNEREYFLKKWVDVIQRDPFYNPNLTLSREDFSIRTYK
jgi:GT2 family glycosyltransferase/SAM-dependent methyltransferase